MNLDFRQLCFEQFFDKNLDDIVIESNVLTENQTLRAKQLIPVSYTHLTLPTTPYV